MGYPVKRSQGELYNQLQEICDSTLGATALARNTGGNVEGVMTKLTSFSLALVILIFIPQL